MMLCGFCRPVIGLRLVAGRFVVFRGFRFWRIAGFLGFSDVGGCFDCLYLDVGMVAFFGFLVLVFCCVLRFSMGLV